MFRFRPRLRFSLRTLFVLVTLAALGCSVAPSIVNAYREWRLPGKRMADMEGLDKLLRNLGPPTVYPDVAIVCPLAQRAQECPPRP